MLNGGVLCGERTTGTHYFLAVVLSGLAALARLFVAPLSAGFPFLTFFPAATLAALVGGTGPGLLAAALGMLLSTYLFIPPVGLFSLAFKPNVAVVNAVFLIDQLLVCGAIHFIRKYHRHYVQALFDLRLAGNVDTRHTSVFSAADVSHSIDNHKNVVRRMSANTADELVIRNIQNIVDAMPMALFVKDIDGRVLLMNKTCEEQWDIPFESIGGTNGSHLFPRNQIEDSLARDREIFACGQQIAFERCIRNVSSSESILVQTVKKPLYDAEGKPLCLIGLSLDITDRNRSVMEYQTILRTTLDGFWVVDLQGRFVDVNDVACQMLGYTRDQILNLSIPDVEAAENPEETRAHIEKILKVGYDRFESRHRHQEGRILDVEVTVNYLAVADGRLIVFVRDITDQKRAELMLRASEARFRSVFENASTGIVVTDECGAAISFNNAFQKILGYSPRQLYGMRFEDFTHGDDLFRDQMLLRDVTEQRSDHYHLEKRVIASNGEVKWVDSFVSAIRDERGIAINFVCIFVDITARCEAETQLNLYAKAFHHGGEGIIITDDENNIVAVNKAFTQLTGYTLADVSGKNPRFLASGNTPKETYLAMWVALYAQGYWQGEVWDRHKDGHIYPKWLAITAVRDKFGEVEHFIASFTDMSERKAAEERISYLAHHDALTGLYNRFCLQERLDQMLLVARREQRLLAVLLIDMDNFKIINDTLGHHIGDGLLVEVAHRLQALVRESDIVARLGGDEFVVVLADLELSTDAIAVAEKIIGVLGETYLVDSHQLESSPSIGIGLYPADGADGPTLMRNADTAMYHAKSKGRNNFQYFTAAMNIAATRRMELEYDLRRAIAENQLRLFYQPQIEASSGRICGVEALVRWQHPDQGLIAPDRFIPVAEETGLILPLGEWVLNEACRQLAEWKARDIRGLCMSVNISAKQLRSTGLIKIVSEALAGHGLSGNELELEITESTAMEDPESAIALLNELRRLHVTLAIDDFGTGYSSLAYLKRLPIQKLKLDRSFVADIELDEDDAAICAATIALAHTLGIKVVAEGVESTGQEFFLSTLHRCDVLQGYLYGRPMPAKEMQLRLGLK